MVIYGCFSFKMRKKGFNTGIVQAITSAGMTSCHLQLSKFFLICFMGVLKPLIGVQYRTMSDRYFPQCIKN